MNKYTVSEATLLALLNYLATRPYTEVFKLVPLLQVPNVELVAETTARVVEDNTSQAV